MSYNLFAESRFHFLRKYIAAFFILFITFVIPVTLSQFVQNNIGVGTSASNSSVKNTNVVVQDKSFSILNITDNRTFLFIIIGLVGILLISWIVLIVIYKRSNRS